MSGAGVAAWTLGWLSLAAALLALAALAWPALWRRATEGRVRGFAWVEPEEVAAGQPVTLHLRVENLAWLPLPRVYLDVELPPPFDPVPGEHLHAGAVLALGLRQRAEVTLGATPLRRGHAHFVPAQMEADDGLGVARLSLALEFRRGLRVLPVRARAPRAAERTRWGGDLEAPDLPSRKPFLPYSARAYAPGDRVRDIDWYLTARRGELAVRRYRQGSFLPVTLALDAATEEPFYSGVWMEGLEALIALAAARAEELGRLGVPVGFWANAAVPTLGLAPARLPAPADPRRLRSAFAGLLGYPTGPGGRFLAALARQLPPGGSLELFTARLDEEAVAHLGTLARRGIPLRLLLALREGEAPPPALATLRRAAGAVPVLLVRPRGLLTARAPGAVPPPAAVAVEEVTGP
ncbi:MAG: DUF58 domain-containing protein [Firmicutes bacterium]|nr:DUF58 domain-containing protein [Bacillota bacterium]